MENNQQGQEGEQEFQGGQEQEQQIELHQEELPPSLGAGGRSETINSHTGKLSYKLSQLSSYQLAHSIREPERHPAPQHLQLHRGGGG